MRAKSEIIESLTSRMNSSDVWKKLKNGLLGRELLALGAEIISESENVKDTMLLQLNPETADKYGLYLLSQMNEIPVTNIKPSAVVVQMASDAKTYAPYELTYNCGNVTFYNLEYTMNGKVVSLICGEPKTMNDSNADIVTFYDGGKSYSGIMLGNAYPDSISVFDGATGVEIPRYSPDTALSNTIDIMYKVVTSVDGKQYIRFICSDGTTEPYSYQIKYIDHSPDAFDFDESDMSVKDGNTVVAEVKYTSQGSVDDLEYMRNQLKGGMSIYNGMNTPKSVERYVNSLPYVIDSKCVASENGGVNVYIKPSSDKDLEMYLNFSEIAAHIALNTVLFPNIKVRTGNRLKFGLSIGGVKDDILQNGIKNMLQQTFAYENLKFNSMVNVSQVLSEIYSHYGIVPSINMNVSEDFVNNKPLSYVPIKNTFKGYDANGALVAWEHDGLLYGRDTSATSIPFFMFEIVCAVGKMFLLKMKVDYIKTEDEIENGVKQYNEAGTSVVKTYSTYNEEVVVPISNKYNRFYLYDASTDMIKPFDNTMNMLLMQDTNPSIFNRAWHTDKQMFGNLYDLEVVSVNDCFVPIFIYKSSGTQTDDGKMVGTVTDEGEATEHVSTYKYWNPNNTYGYSQYLNGANTTYGGDGKYQTMLVMKQSPSLMDLSSDAWNMAWTGDGLVDFKGFYSGLKNIDNNGIKHNIKSNLFVYEDNVYWISSITDSTLLLHVLKGGNKDIAIPMNGVFRGIIPFGDNVYVIFDRSITKVEGFSGFKQKIKTYNAYRDYNTPLNIIEIQRGFDKHIIFRTPTEVFVGDGFDELSESKMSFRNIKQIFADVDISECSIGSCTGEFATIYKRVEDESTTSLVFYCYNLETGEVFIRDKTSNGNPDGETTSSVKTWEYDNMLSSSYGDTITIDSSGLYPKPVGSLMKMFYNVDSEDFEVIDTEKGLVTYTVQRTEYCLGESPDDEYEFVFSSDYEGKKGATLPTFHGYSKLGNNPTPHVAKKCYHQIKYMDYSAEAIVMAYLDSSVYQNAGIGGKLSKFVEGRDVTISGEVYNRNTDSFASIIDAIAYGDDNEARDLKKWLSYRLTGAPYMGSSSLGITYYLKVWVDEKITTYTYTQTLSSQAKTIGWIDYKNNTIVNESGISIDTIKYDCKTPNLQDDTYLVLDKNSINFE